MPWLVSAILLCVASLHVAAINRPVYKIVLNQKGYAQFLQYDIDTPPVKEFTFCTWFRIYDLLVDQSIFTYVANSNNRVVRLWLDSGGRQMKVSINGQATSASAVDVAQGVWRHVCLSYQSDHGAWALYLDARLVSCDVAPGLYGYVLPGGGSVIVGYGTNDNGGRNGLEGEIFGANMILISTIEQNYTMKSNPYNRQKTFTKNTINDHTGNAHYVILKDLQTGEVNNKFETYRPHDLKNTRNFIKFLTPYSSVAHDVGIHLIPKNIQKAKALEKEMYELPSSTTDLNSNFWNLNQYDFRENFSRPQKSISKAKDFMMLTEYETPPPFSTPTYSYKSFDKEESTVYKKQSKYNMQTTESLKYLQNDNYKSEIPPPGVNKYNVNNNEAYNQWTSSKFANSVLDHLKNIRLQSKDQRNVPPTIPLYKFSDSHPYPTEFKKTKLRSPLQFQRKHLVERRFDSNKRSPQINVHILEDDLRSNIMKSHAQTQLKHVQITNRGRPKQSNQHRFYRKVNSQEFDVDSGSTESLTNPKASHTSKITKWRNSYSTKHQNNLIGSLPFLKSLEISTDDSSQSNEDAHNNMYTRSIPGGNKWHNVKSYSNDYTPRKINVETAKAEGGIDEQYVEPEQKHPSLRLKYKHENRKVVAQEAESILKARELALGVMNKSDNTGSISILKFNHGFLPDHNIRPTTVKVSEKINKLIIPTTGYEKISNFNRNVKIGNALNEQETIGVNEKDKMLSFLGGNDRIPDINRYRSDIDMENLSAVPSSSQPTRVCKNIELYDRVLYVQPDESIDMSHILSPVKAKNTGIQFIIENYKKCSLEESHLQHNAMLFIDWSRTPVRLFGGARPVETTDLCGFF